MSLEINRGDDQNRILLLVPTKRDAEITASLLQRSGLGCFVCKDMLQLAEETRHGAGAILLTEHLLSAHGLEHFLDVMNDQPAWSDLPVVTLMKGDAISEACRNALSRLRNVTLIDRPSPVHAIVSAVQAAVRSRQRQYQIRDYLETLRDTENRLHALAESLESQVELRTQELERRNAAIAQQAEQLRELSNRVQQSQDEERRRIARELHDSAGQVLAAIGMHLAIITQCAGEPKVRKAAEESNELVRQLGKEIRTVSYLLHPPMLDEGGLPSALKWYTEGLIERSGLKIGLDVSPDLGRLPDAIEMAIFRIVQECLTNIHRHSGAQRVAIRLAHDISTVTLEIRDDGSGIAKDTLAAILAQRSGVGIAGMRERVRYLRGSFDIESDSTGTRVSIKLPVVTSSVGEVETADNA